MTIFESLLQQPLVVRAGWTLVHFLWQGSVIAIALAVVRGAIGSWLQARARYALSCVALALMCAAPPLTFIVLGRLDPSALSRPIWPMETGGAWERLLPWIVVGWLCGVVLFSARVAIGWREAMRLRTAAVEPPPPEWQEALERLVRRMQVSTPVRLLMSPLANTPAVVGWLKPVILMPVEAVIGLPLSQVQSLLAHELAHIRRNDYLVNILQSLAEAVLFYHPAVWWISGQIRTERELCCDDLAVEASDDVLTYATALAALETHRRARLRAAMAADGGSLLKRVRRLAGEADSQPHHLPGPGAAWVLALLWMAGAGAVAMHANPAQPMRALRPFTHPGIAIAPQPRPLPPAPAAPRSAPFLSSLLFDPFFPVPQIAAPPAATDDASKRLASISGTVFSTAGKPVDNARVRLVPINSAAGSVVSIPLGAVAMPATPQAPPTTQTDAEGKFSLSRVPPGSYTIQFQRKGFSTATYGARPGLSTGTVLTLDEGRNVTGIEMKLPEPGVFVGRTLDADGDPIAHLLVVAQVKHYYYPQARGEIVASTYSGDNGDFRLIAPPGRYYLVAQRRPTWTVTDRAPIVVAKPGQKPSQPGNTYWGGANNLKSASPVEIGSGQTVLLGDYKIADMPLLHVRGKVIGDPALLKGARVVRVPPPNDSLGWSLGADIQPDGSFELTNMNPYEITIAAYSMNLGYLGFTDLVVGDEDIENVRLSAAATPFSGTVVVENAALETQAPPLPKRIELVSTGFYKVSSAMAIKPDGTFTFPTLARGSYFLNVTGIPTDAYVKSARFNSRDVLTEPLAWDRSPGGLEIVISQKAPVLDGSLVDADGKPVPGTVTLVADPQRPGHPLFYPTAKADQNGAFRFQTVAPGSYRILAWESIPDGAHGVPDFIEPFVGGGERIELMEGDHKTMVLKRISLEKMDDTLRRAGK